MTPTAFKINLFQTARRVLRYAFFPGFDSQRGFLTDCPLADVVASGFGVAQVGFLPCSC